MPFTTELLSFNWSMMVSLKLARLLQLWGSMSESGQSRYRDMLFDLFPVGKTNTRLQPTDKT
jgi:hypothetical protein